MYHMYILEDHSFYIPKLIDPFFYCHLYTCVLFLLQYLSYLKTGQSLIVLYIEIYITIIRSYVFLAHARSRSQCEFLAPNSRRMTFALPEWRERSQHI